MTRKIGSSARHLTLLDTLHRDGLAVLLDRFADLLPFRRHLDGCPAYANHVRQGKTLEGTLGARPVMCHDMADVLAAPGFFKLALALTPLAQSYLGVEPVLYSLNAFYTEPTAKEKPDIQHFHRDTDDTSFLALFLYGTDVLRRRDGPHEFFYGTHRPGGGSRIREIYGLAGTLFLADTRGWHRGAMPSSRRLLAWARWGVSDPPAAYKWDGLKPVDRARVPDYPDDPVLRRIVRLVAA